MCAVWILLILQSLPGCTLTCQMKGEERMGAVSEVQSDLWDVSHHAACAFRRNKKLNLVIWGVGNKRQLTWHLEGFKWLNELIFWWGSSDKISKFISVLANKTKARVWAQVVIHTVYLLARFLVIFFFFSLASVSSRLCCIFGWLVGMGGRVQCCEQKPFYITWFQNQRTICGPYYVVLYLYSMLLHVTGTPYELPSYPFQCVL